ncbi:MAG: GTP 3',8-cyclase MoaA [Acidobacteria bacterium]|nr:MAG: GTP 3',8-cyclase MoaA [Acidobacteriota bacterium]
MRPVIDRWNRPLRSLRISVTDRCNLRCQYCMPEEEYVWLNRHELLTYEEIAEIADIFTQLGVEKIRFTGGEPLLRRDLDILVRLLAQNDRIRDLALTTNGILLASSAERLRRAGLHRLTVSLDTLRPDRFRALTRKNVHAQVLEGIEVARRVGFEKIKLNTVVVRGFNDDELVDLIAFGKEMGAEVRFIEYMDVGGATRWSMEQVVSRSEMLSRLERQLGPIEPLNESEWAPADRYMLPDGTVFGIISSITQPFCCTCDRARLTSDGIWFLCLYAQEGVDLKRLLRAGASREHIAAAIMSAWRQRTDRGAEQRKALREQRTPLPAEDLRKNPHLEMHTRGG